MMKFWLNGLGNFSQSFGNCQNVCKDPLLILSTCLTNFLIPKNKLIAIEPFFYYIDSIYKVYKAAYLKFTNTHLGISAKPPLC